MTRSIKWPIFARIVVLSPVWSRRSRSAQASSTLSEQKESGQKEQEEDEWPVRLAFTKGMSPG